MSGLRASDKDLELPLLAVCSRHDEILEQTWTPRALEVAVKMSGWSLTKRKCENNLNVYPGNGQK